MTNFSMIITLNVLIFLLLTYLSNGDPQYVHYDCPRGEYTYATGSTFEANLTNTLLNILPINASLSGYSKLNSGEKGLDQVYALAYCRADVKGRDCSGCVEAAARNIIQRCRLLKEGIIWYEECTLRYSNQSDMFLVDNLEVTPSHRHYNFSGTFRYLEGQEMEFGTLMNRLVHEAAYVGNQSGFATGESNISGSNWMLRGLVQCRPDIGGDYCERCLRQAFRQKDGWNTPMVFLPSCGIRYDLYPYPHTSRPSTPGGGVSLKIIVPVVVAGVLVLCCIIFFIIHCRRCNLQRQHPPEHQQEQDDPRKFSYIELVWATACFSRRRIVGKGGFGNVYKGTLLDGTLVAVKRLNVRGALQGEAEFVSEVKAITHLKHDNIVSLIGYCTFLRERMLVYNFVSNNTLQHHLHGNGKDFSWEKRFKTALNLAEVFAFLHERNPAIIHRDIKPSNILFDGEFQPKVGDFGVARLCSDSQTHLTTIIRGSPGYVDPDYFTSEHLSRKSDVFAFGVVLLELITGHKAIISTLEEIGENKHIIEWAEPSIKEALSIGNFEALVDKNLGSTYNFNEMDRMIICAATCVRKDPEDRPTMRQVAEVLKESNVTSRELKERLIGLWLRDEAQRRIYDEGGLLLSGSPRTLGQTVNGYSDSESHNPEMSHELYYTASPRYLSTT